MLKEFKEFAVKGNMIDMAVGIIIGVAFGAIITSLVNDVIMPPIGVLLGNVDFSDVFIQLGGDTPMPSVAAAAEAGIPTLNIGIFVNTVINFLIIAFSVFIVVKQMNRLKRRAEEAPKEPETPTPSQDIVLLTEIRDLLKQG